TASISVAHRRDVLVVSQAALRFRPPGRMPAQKFSLLPRPPDLVRETPADAGPALYVLRAGELVRLSVETGLSDGRRTEVTAPGLKAGDQVVLEMAEERS
ncbi:MAG: efflux RND transporter periplasmic adaptor subunit, partial [Acidobacteriota bacterium]